MLAPYVLAGVALVITLCEAVYSIWKSDRLEKKVDALENKFKNLESKYEHEYAESGRFRKTTNERLYGLEGNRGWKR